MTPSVLIPATMLFPTNNVLVISAHYPDYEEYTVHLTFAVFGVYASYDEERCCMAAA